MSDHYLVDLEFANMANIKAARKFKAERDDLMTALEAIAMRDQEFGFDAGKVAREAVMRVLGQQRNGS